MTGLACALIDEAGEAFVIAEARGRRVEAGGLIAPARVVGMLADRHELDVGEAEVDDIGDEAVGERVPGEEPAVRVAVPRAGVDLVD